MTRTGPTRTLARAALIGGPVLVGAAAVARFAATNLCTFRRDWRSVLAAGYTENQVVVDGVVINYGEGPARGKPPLLLIHGQASDWKSYAPALPDLAAMFHVYAVDVPGHGGSDRIADGYTAIGIGALLKRFVDDVIGEPVVLSGHSSGGQLAAWLAANAPDDVTAVLLEDPPMFTTLLPRAEKTWNWVDLATCCHSFLTADDTDFVRYYWVHQYMGNTSGPEPAESAGSEPDPATGIPIVRSPCGGGRSTTCSAVCRPTTRYSGTRSTPTGGTRGSTMNPH